MHPRELSILDFSYDLPEDRVAQQPLAERDASKLLVFRDGSIEDRTFSELVDALPAGALLVLNDTRVVHARVAFERVTGAALECMVLTPESGRPIEQALQDRDHTRWWCFMGNAKRWKGEELIVRKDGYALHAERIEHRDGEHLIEFGWDCDGTFLEQLDRFGAVPLPPYMRRLAVASDDTRYNTVFGERHGSVAAPTASLHFSHELLARLNEKGVRSTTLTLHVGAGTFLPVKAATMADHAMHAEQVRIPLNALKQMSVQLGEAPIVAVGTTALRSMESLYWHGVMLLQGRAGAEMAIVQWEPYTHEDPTLPTALEALRAVIAQVEGNVDRVLVGSTQLLIAPGYTFRYADALVTNFHQPQSTLLLLVAAFVGPGWRTMYSHALANNYRFLSYGDGSLLFRRT